MSMERLMTIKNFNLPECSECADWVWCFEIPQECPKGDLNGNKLLCSTE